jgi:hypothetical protein
MMVSSLFTLSLDDWLDAPNGLRAALTKLAHEEIERRNTEQRQRVKEMEEKQAIENSRPQLPFPVKTLFDRM